VVDELAIQHASEDTPTSYLKWTCNGEVLQISRFPCAHGGCFGRHFASELLVNAYPVSEIPTYASCQISIQPSVSWDIQQVFNRHQATSLSTFKSTLRSVGKQRRRRGRALYIDTLHMEGRRLLVAERINCGSVRLTGIWVSGHHNQPSNRSRVLTETKATVNRVLPIPIPLSPPHVTMPP